MSKFTHVFKQKDVLKKILFTLFIIIIYRIGCYLPVPGIPTQEFAEAFKEASSSSALMVLDVFSGGALSSMGILSLGIMPYITASIIMTLMSNVIPKVAQWRKDGEGRRQITKWTRILTIFIGLINAIGYDLLFKSPQYGIVYNPAVPGILNDIMVVFALMIGVVLIMWLGELITQHGIGNGMSVIIFTSVVSRVAPAIWESASTAGFGEVNGSTITVIIFLAIILVIPAMVFVERSQRRIPVHSTKAGSSSRFARRNDTNYIAFKVSGNAMIAIIFASALSYMPSQIAAFLNIDWLSSFASAVITPPFSLAITAILVVIFMFFYNSVQYDTDNMAENLKRSGSYIAGIRPGQPTSEYLYDVLTKITWPGALYTVILAVGSAALFTLTNNPLLQAFGSTSILIAVSVSMQIMTAIEQSLRANDPEAVLKRLG